MYYNLIPILFVIFLTSCRKPVLVYFAIFFKMCSNLILIRFMVCPYSLLKSYACFSSSVPYDMLISYLCFSRNIPYDALSSLLYCQAWVQFHLWICETRSIQKMQMEAVDPQVMSSDDIGIHIRQILLTMFCDGNHCRSWDESYQLVSDILFALFIACLNPFSDLAHCLHSFALALAAGNTTLHFSQ